MGVLLAIIFIFLAVDIRIERQPEPQQIHASYESYASDLPESTLYAFPIIEVTVVDVQQVRQPKSQSAEAEINTLGIRPYSKDEVQELIRIHSANVGIDVQLALRIASCESGLRWDAKNKSSTASGVFQYLSGTWRNTSEGKKGTSVFDADANIRMAVTSIAVHGTQAWAASEKCWSA